MFPCSTQWLLAFSSSVDAFFLLLIAASYRAIQQGRWSLFSVLILVGTFTKVTIWGMVLVAAAAHVHQSKKNENGVNRGSLSSGIFWLAALVPSIMAKFAVERIWPPTSQRYSYLGDIRMNLKLKLLSRSVTFPAFPQITEFLASFVLVFGIVTVVYVVEFRSLSKVFHGKPHLLVFLVVMMALSFVGGFDDARYMPYVAIPVLYAYANILQRSWHLYTTPWMVGYLAVGSLLLSDIANPDPSSFGAYMPHYANWPAEAPFVARFVAVLIAGMLLKKLTLRYRGNTISAVQT
jgi:hypothetical protein